MHRLRPAITSILTLTAVLLVAASSVLAQTGAVKGKVRNLRGDGIPAASVTARLNGKDLRTVRADNKGDFLIDGLEPGSYNLVVDANGYSSGIKYGVEIANGKTRDLGDRLILSNDRGAFVIVEGSVFSKSGTILPGAEIKIERIKSNGSTQKIGSTFSNNEGEFSFRQRPGPAKFRITASYKDKSATRDIEVDTAAIYRLALSLDLDRPQD